MADSPPVDPTLGSPPAAPRGLLRFVLVALTLLPPLLVVRVIYRSTVDVPFWDQWELVSLLDRSFEAWPTIGDLFAPHNEHRLGFPRMVMLALARASGWNTRVEVTASLLIALGTFWLLLAVARRTTAPLASGSPLRTPVLSAIFFSLVAWENWTWGWQLQIFMCVAAVTGALALLGGRELGPGRLTSGLLLGLIATYSFGNGALVWPLGLLVIALRDDPSGARWTRAAVWGVAAVLVVSPYLIDYAPPPVGEKPSWFQLAAYVPIYVGAPLVPWSARIAAVVGVLGLLSFAVTAAALLRSGRLRRRDLLTFAALGAYALGSGLLTSASRAGLGPSQALSSRYTTISVLLWLALVVLLDALSRERADDDGERPTRATRLGARIAIAAIVGLSLVASEHGRVSARRHARALAPARDALRARRDDGLLGRLYPHQQLLPERVRLLERRRLSVFRDDDD